MSNGNFQKVANDWTALTNAEKITLFTATNYETPTAAELATLGKFRIVSYSPDNSQPTCKLTAVPADQVITPKKLISLATYEKIDSVSITNSVSGSSAIKLAITTELSTYYTYDFTNAKWTVIDIADASTFLTDGIDVAKISTIPTTAWVNLNPDSIGFAYLLSMTAVAESCGTDALVLTVDMKGSWNKAVYGTDTTYGYPNNDVLQVELLTNGDYKINYNAGAAASS